MEFLRYVGPGLLVTVGFIDPGNWASNLAAGSQYGYSLLWMVSVGTIMLILLQHNVAHLGIVTGLCLSEASTKFFRPSVSRFVLGTAVLAAIATSLAEILGAAIGLRMLFGLPLAIGSLLSAGFVLFMLFSNSYRRLERWIIGFVSLIGFAFLAELWLVRVDWHATAAAWVVPAMPQGSLMIVMSVLGAVVMPHNIYLHSEVIQSRQWHLEDEATITRQLRYEFLDTLFSMGVGWAINSAMIIMAAATFYAVGTSVDQLEEAQHLLEPLLGNGAALLFAGALLMSGLSSSVTAGMAGGTIFAGIFCEAYNTDDWHTKVGIGITVIGALVAILFVGDPFRGLVVSQMLLSMQLPFTIVSQILLTSSADVMGKYANNTAQKLVLWTVAAIVILLNVLLLRSLVSG
ncbi:MAG TPA: Nramp family divalent metal transporter [Candidatus Ozemobacteraceae bacterium]|nr:Nramp family divalent metal transporter [Candidatus Ozemobacteraceae bacterium]